MRFIIIYKLFSNIFSIFHPFYLLLFIFRRKKELSLSNRLGYSTLNRGCKDIIWIHASSVGETISVIEFIKIYKRKFLNCEILLTTTTKTSKKIADEKLKGMIIHQFIPYDNPIFMRRFLKYWKPKICYLVESEIWPFLILETSIIKCPIILLNARISEKSFKKWIKIPHKWLFEKINKAFAPSVIIKERLVNLGVKNIEICPNIKFLSVPLTYDSNECEKIKNLVQNRSIWIASSTHKHEEDIFIKLQKKILETNDNKLLIIIPRHPERSFEIIDICKKYNLRYDLFSKIKEKITCDVLISDVIGKNGLFYSIAKKVVMGGSFVDIGGHNPIEPLWYKCSVFFGPYMYNFSDVIEILKMSPLKDKRCLLENILSDDCDNCDSFNKINYLKKIVEKKLFDSI